MFIVIIFHSFFNNSSQVKPQTRYHPYINIEVEKDQDFKEKTKSATQQNRTEMSF